MQMSSRTNGSIIVKQSLIAMLAFVALFCVQAKGSRPAVDGNAVAVGTWGGEHVILEVSGKGAAAEFDCAHGQITQPMALDQHGDFDVVGTFTPEHGGPVGRDEDTPPAQARYSGHIDGDAMSLTVTLGKEKLGPFTLTRGSRPNLRKCR
jgi:hypothetical protein